MKTGIIVVVVLVVVVFAIAMWPKPKGKRKKKKHILRDILSFLDEVPEIGTDAGEL